MAGPAPASRRWPACGACAGRAPGTARRTALCRPPRPPRWETPLAVRADPGGGPARLRRTAWEEDAIAELQQRAAAMPDLQSRWRAAENATHAAFADQLAALSLQGHSDPAGFVATFA